MQKPWFQARSEIRTGQGALCFRSIQYYFEGTPTTTHTYIHTQGVRLAKKIEMGLPCDQVIYGGSWPGDICAFETDPDTEQ